MTRTDRFTYERALRADRRLPWATRSLGLLLATYMDQSGAGAWPSIGHQSSGNDDCLVAVTGLCRSVVFRHLARLESAGYLGVERRPGKPSRRFAALPDPSTQADGSTVDSPGDNSGDPSTQVHGSLSTPVHPGRPTRPPRWTDPSTGVDPTKSLPSQDQLAGAHAHARVREAGDPEEAATVYTDPADHDPHSLAAFADRLRSELLVDYTDTEVGWAVRRLRDAASLDEPTARAALRRIVRNKPRSLHRYVAKIVDRGDVERYTADSRPSERSATAGLAKQVAELRRLPECEHGEPGGDQPHPTNGKALCPLCRADRGVGLAAS